MAITAIQSNPIPTGGTTATAPVPPTLTPADIAALTEQLTSVQSRFRQASSPLNVLLPRATLALGQQVPVQISSVGLGYRLRTHWHLVISIVNASSNTQGASVSVSPNFPFNVVQNSQVQINGGSATYNAGGVSDLSTMLRTRKGTKRIITYSGFGPSLDEALVQVTVGSNLTATNSAAGTPTISGIASLNCAASATGTLTVDFWTVEKLALDRDSLLGALPLQNNSTYAQLQRQLVGALYTATRNDLNQPFYTAGASLTISLTSAYADTTYDFWAIPDQADLYQAMISNSYQVQEVTNVSLNATGVQALLQNLPQNMYLVALHLLSIDSSGVVIPYANITRTGLQYNGGSITPVNEPYDRHRLAQLLDYDYDLGALPGFQIWDGEATSDDITASDNAGWVDLYQAANPQYFADIAAGVTIPLVYNYCREQVVAGAVQQIGG